MKTIWAPATDLLCGGVTTRWSNFQNFSYWENVKCQILRLFFFPEALQLLFENPLLPLEIPVVRGGQGEVSPQLCRPLLCLSAGTQASLFALHTLHPSFLCSVCPTCTLTPPQDWCWEVGVGGGRALLDKDSSGLAGGRTIPRLC